MIDISEKAVEDMAALNNDIVALIDASKVSPLGAIMVLELIRSNLIKAFEIRATRGGISMLGAL